MGAHHVLGLIIGQDLALMIVMLKDTEGSVAGVFGTPFG